MPRVPLRSALLILVVLSAAFVLAGCGGSDSRAGNAKNLPPTMAYDEASWPQVEHKDRERDHEFPSSAPDSARGLKNPLGDGNQSDIDKGTALFQANCARCHGPEGRGDGPDSAGLEPPPANLAEGHFSAMPDSLVYYIVTTGIKGSKMPSWEELSAEDRWRIILYLRSIAPAMHEGTGNHGGGHGNMDM